MSMLANIPRISVLIICYKQEELIKRAIESLLRQKDYIYEICVTDDCSPDNTYSVLEEYSCQYPGLLKLHRNNPNVGIFENIEYSWTMPTGEIIYQLSGDDECGEGWFKTVIDYIKNNHIDYQNELFCIYGDYQAMYPNGDSFILSNRMIATGYNPLGLALRKLICSRSVCYSKKVLDRFIKVSEGRSYAAESAQDMQVQIFSKKNYYIPIVGNIYHTGIGVSTGKNRVASRIDPKTPMESLQTVIKSANYQLPKSDIVLTQFFQKRAEFNKEVLLYPEKNTLLYKIKIKAYLLMLKLLSANFRLGIKGFRVKRYLFAIVRRIPHKNTICWNI